MNSYIFILILFMLFTPIYAVEKVPIIHINVNQLSGFQVGLEIGNKSKVLFENIEKEYDAHLAMIMSQSTFNEIVKSRLSKLLKNINNIYLKELTGVAEAWSLVNIDKLGDGNLSWNEYQVLNLLPDVGFAPNGSGIAVFNNISSESSPIVGRNLDWVSTAHLRSVQAITVYHYKDRAVVNIGFAGIVSIINGFNDQGLFLALFNSEPYSPYINIQPLTKKDVYASSFELRKVLETQISMQYAVDNLKNKSYSLNHNVLIADKTSVHVLEQPIYQKSKLRSWSSSIHKPWNKKYQIIVTDCFVSKELINNCQDIKDNIHWERLQQLSNFNINKLATIDDISSILFDTHNNHYEIFNTETVSSIIYTPINNNLYLYVAPNNNSPDDLSLLPIREAYLDLTNTSTSKDKDKDKNIIWIIWLLLAIISSITLWVFFTEKNLGK